MSEFIKLADIPSILEDLIDNATLTDPIDGTTKQRPVVLVFHESSADLKYLDTVGYNSDNAENIVEVVDTREMHQYAVRSNNSASLASVLGSLEIQYKHLHNAGNDAVYTLQAMVGLAVKKRLSSLEAACGKKSQT
jgi:DNA polymerase III alpha subunit (gram-positive type)